LGTSKVESIKNFIKNLNSDVRTISYHTLLNSKNALDLFKDFDVILDASDNVATRYLLNDACVLLKKPLVSGSALQLEGQLTVYNYKGGPCYRCIFPKPPPKETVMNCGDGGVLGAVTSVIGSLQSMEVIKIILDQENVMSGKLLLYDAASCTFRNIKLRAKKDDCEVCGSNPTITELIDYEQFCGMAATDKDSGLNLLKKEERISVEEYSKVTDSHLLIDVRSANEFEICQLKNSMNVPIKQLLDGKLGDLPRNQIKESEVYVVCRRGNDSQRAVRYLADEYEIKAKDLIGGLHAWTKEIDKDFPIY
jgi:adenylyltransferase and sulfurtransferase